METNHSIILLSIERKGRKYLREDGLEIRLFFFFSKQSRRLECVGWKEGRD